MQSFFELIHDFDMQILEWIANIRGYYLDQIMIFITTIGNQGLVWIVLGLGLMVTKKYRFVGLVSLLALIIGTLLTDVSMKFYFARVRPYTYLTDYKLLIEEPSSFSFPSGHATASFAAAGVIAYYIKSYRFPVLVFASLMAFSRMYLYVHFTSDVIAGVLVGLSSSVLAIMIATKLTKERNSQLEYND